MKWGNPFRNELAGVSGWINDSLDSLAARIAGVWNVEHKDDGTHKDVTADSLAVGELTELIDATAFGVHTISASGAGAQVFMVRNTDTTGSSGFRLGTPGGDYGGLYSYNGGYTGGATGETANGVNLIGSGNGGLTLSATNGTSGADIHFYARGTGGAALAEIARATRSTGGGNPAVFWVLGGAFGAGTVQGAALSVWRNESGNGSPGLLLLQDKGATFREIWIDTSGDVRVGAAGTTNENIGDTGGTVVGTQTSSRDSKQILGRFTDTAGALQTILATPLYRFTYKSGSFNGEEFTGIVAEESPAFAMDQGKSFNPVTAFGYTVAAIQALQVQVDDLRRELAAARKG